MTLTESDAREVAADLLDTRRAECARLDEIRRYVRGETCKIFVPRKAGREYHQLVKMSLTNIMPLIISTFAENLFIEGYRPSKSSKNSPAWDRDWQPNRMDQRQSSLWRTALTYGLAYATVVPGKLDGEAMGLITPFSPRQLTAVYEDPINDEWPVYAITVTAGYDAEYRRKVQRVELIDDGTIYRFIRDGQSDSTLQFVSADEHKLNVGEGLAPVVRFVSAGGDLDDQSAGEVEPLMAPQDALNNTTFGLRSTERAQAYPQRYATNLIPQIDDKGNELEPFQGGADKVWTSTGDSQFGQFPAASLDGYLGSRQSTLRIITALAQVAPHTLLISDGISNLSAEALAALEAAQQRKVGELKTTLGEAGEQMLRLTSLAAGDDAGWKDRSAEVVWRDTESRSLAQLADALGKMVQMLAIPPQAVWELLPISDETRQRWAKMADAEDAKDAETPQPGVPAPPTPEQLMMAGGGDGVSAGAAGPAGPARAPGKRVPASA